MGCCGQKRSQAMGGVRVAALAAMPTTMPGAADAGVGVTMWSPLSTGGLAHRGPSSLQGARSIMLRYRERASVVVRGPVTGRTYTFATASPSQPVEARDAEPMLRTRRFERA